MIIMLQTRICNGSNKLKNLRVQYQAAFNTNKRNYQITYQMNH